MAGKVRLARNPPTTALKLRVLHPSRYERVLVSFWPSQKGLDFMHLRLFLFDSLLATSFGLFEGV